MAGRERIRKDEGGLERTREDEGGLERTREDERGRLYTWTQHNRRCPRVEAVITGEVERWPQ